MKMNRPSWSFSIFCAALSASTGCGDISKSEGDAMQSPDALIDTGVPADAGAGAARIGVVSLSELRVLPGFGTRYGILSKQEFYEVGPMAARQVYGDDAFAGCRVWHHVAGESDPEFVNEGDLSYAGDAAPTVAVPQCKFSGGAYDCVVGTLVNRTVTFTANIGQPPLPVNSTSILVQGADFDAPPYNGANVVEFEFSDSPLGAGGRYLVTNTSSSNPSLVSSTTFAESLGPVAGVDIVVRPAAVGASTFYLAPDWNPIVPAASATAFVRFQKQTGTLTSAHDVSLVPSGEGIELDEAFDRPFIMPTVARDVTFACATPQCGQAIPGVTRLWRVEGRTTSARDNTTGTKWNGLMYEPIPGTTYSRFACQFIGGDRAVIPSDALSKILENSPAAIYTLVTYGTAEVIDDGQAQTTYLLGHSVDGVTSIPAM